MKFKGLSSLFLLFISIGFSAQELTLEIPQHVEKKAVTDSVQGVRKEMLGTVQLDQNGKVRCLNP
jgi:hypothetical protein